MSGSNATRQRKPRIIVLASSCMLLIAVLCVPYASACQYTCEMSTTRSRMTGLYVRGGALASKQTSTTAIFNKHHQQNPTKTSVTKASPQKSILQPRNVLLSTILVATVAITYQQRSILAPLFDRNRLQQLTLDYLRKLQPDNDDGQSSSLRPLLMYMFAMAAWELLGLSTIPVETAAAMVFGYSAMIPSALGKLLGAVTAYTLGRTVLSNWATRKLSSQKIFQLLESGSHHHKGSKHNKLHIKKDKLDFMRTPFATAMLIKYSCFPEFIKNFGSSLILPVTIDKFILATMIHGWSFTALWTVLGVDASLRLVHPSRPRNMGLTVCIALTFVIGFVLSPALMVWWIRDLQQRSSSSKSNKRYR